MPLTNPFTDSDSSDRMPDKVPNEEKKKSTTTTSSSSSMMPFNSMPTKMPPIIISSTPENILEFEDFGHIFQIAVGQFPLQRSFCIGQQTLGHYSGTFRCLSTSAPDFNLPYENPDAFGRVFYFLVYQRFFDYVDEPTFLIGYDEITEIWDIGCRYLMPLIMNAAINLFARKIKISKTLPDKRSVDYIWTVTPPGSTLRRLLVDLVREMWLPDGNRCSVWVNLVGGMSSNADELVWAIEALKNSHHTVRTSHKTTVRLLACEWHSHEAMDTCEGSEEYQLLPEHLLRF